MAPSPPADLQLPNWFNALLAGEKQNVIPGEASELSKHKPHISNKRKWQGIVVVGFHLWRTEIPICLLGLLSRTIFCLPGAQIQDVAEKPPRFSGCYSLLLIHMGTNDTARGDQRSQEWLQGSASEDQELQTGQPHCFSCKNHGPRPLGAHFWANEGEGVDLEESAWVYQGSVMPEQSDCSLW